MDVASFVSQYGRDLLVLILSPVLVVGAVAWIARGLLGRSFERDLARYQKDLAADLERFKSQLALEVEILSNRESLLQQKRAEVVGTLYGLIVDAYSRISSMTYPIDLPGVDSNAIRAEGLQAMGDTTKYFDRHRIYLPCEVVDSVNAVISLFMSVTMQASEEQSKDGHGRNLSVPWGGAERELRNTMPTLTKELERSFQALLGVTGDGEHKEG